MFDYIGKDVKAHHTVRSYGRNSIGDNSIILDNVILGFPSTKLLLNIRQVDLNLENADYEGCTIGKKAIIRSDAVIYCDVKIGDDVRTGHKILVREGTRIGDNVLIGTNTVIDNNCKIGSHINIQSCVYMPTGTIVEDYVFLGPSVTFTNDRYPIRLDNELESCVIKKGASLGANCVILPGVTVGEGSIVAAGAVVTSDVPNWHLAIGSPSQYVRLKNELKVLNRII